ncbi:MAG: branched-chain amino acid ABC transporter substrate-binding protein [Bradyrhizobiaceae bacterium]|nr:MAG: branched-chain amino acid ABC transporter substrate-binding protein [Bradyrhizobiaceae bacterium]
MVRKMLAATAAFTFLTSTVLFAQEKPAEVRVGISTFLSGPASVFGEPAKQAAEMIVDEINKSGGILGVPVRVTYVDEGAGTEALTTEYKRLAQDGKVDVFFASISSGNCNKIAPLAEDLKILNFMWDCGTQTILEQNKYRYVYRTQANATPEVIAPLLYLLKTKPDFKTIAVVNQDYAWGRDSWAIFQAALKQIKPDAQVVAELFPKFGAPDYSTEVSRLLALRPDVVLSTSWGGDLDTFVRQAAQRGLMKNSTFVLALGESSLQRIGKDLPDGVIVGARGDHYFLHPENRDDPKFKAFMEAFKTRTGSYPIYPVFHISQAFAALQAAYSRAAAANGGKFPNREQVVDAMKDLKFQGLGRPITIRADGQGVEDQLVGVTKRVDAYPFPVIDDMMIFSSAKIMPPTGQKSEEWIATLKPDMVDVAVDKFKHR